ncbi:hypothetical protein K9B35_00310 [Sphingomonas sp. R647]|uniref:hypothetical protein n=1 Tax=Sphingomonas sp. R647 TaxID=2875233 RepID=UPI001CD615EB|nr:hypothetical protein [Sphingomonas sp. R647]MCA1196397.1 hypothetical protein [Sphingomonas sp. R647]
MEYPTQIDCAWLATDACGRLAAMITAGEGPIPAAVLESRIDVTDIEGKLLDLPIMGDAMDVANVPNPSSFIDLSRRGFYVYDWTDVHRPSSQALGAYELVASPSVSIRLEDLPADLQELPSRIKSIDAIGGAHLEIR